MRREKVVQQGSQSRESESAALVASVVAGRTCYHAPTCPILRITPSIMTAPASPSATDEPTPTTNAPADTPAPHPSSLHAGWNLIVLAAHHVVLRLAWIFKTETVLMPAFLDVIAGAGWIRGCLPVLNRIGQSVPPLLVSASLRNSRRKSYWVLASTLTMSVMFGVLAVLCMSLGTREMPWLPMVFLGIYAIFFAATGINQMSFNTLQGKLIPAGRRGRLMSIAGMAGSIVAMTAAFFLLAPWLAMPDGSGFARIFGFTSAMFALSSLIVLFIREPADERGTAEAHPARLVRNVYRTLRENKSLRRTGMMAVLFMCSMLLFPHYQWLGREMLGASGADLMWWVVVQNGAVGLFSWLAGACGDRWGYRIVIRCEIFASACIPFVALGLAYGLTPETRSWYLITFFLLGLYPVSIKSLFNYVLELAHEEHHPHYLSTLSLCMAAPLAFSPLAGWLIDINPVAVFSGIACIVLVSGLMTFLIVEPREHPLVEQTVSDI